MNVLVLGGTGFIGSHLCDALLQNEHTVRVYSRSKERYREPLFAVDYCTGDFSDEISLAEALIGIDCVVHLISTTVPTTSNLNPALDVISNLAGTLNLLELLKKNGPKKIIFLSSGGTVYGDPTVTPVHETHALNPICSYGVVKVAIENYLGMYQKLYGIESLVLRVSNPYGPRQGHMGVQGLISSFLNRVKSHQDLIVWGDGEIIRDYIYISDLANLLVKSLTSGKTGIFNVGSGQGYSVNQIIRVICNETQVTPKIIYKVGRDYDVNKIYLDISKAQEAFGWDITTDLNSGIKRHWDWMQHMSYM